MMLTTVHECYGFRIACTLDPRARDVVDRFFGPPLHDRADQPHVAAPTARLTIDVNDSTAAAVEPPHTAEVIASDPITIDTGSSRAVIDPAAWSATVSLAGKDLDDPIVWGRWILERLFLYLVCRSPRHYPLHAGAIAAEGQVALISAATGVGKSTFTWWARRRGAQLLGEDIMVRHLDDDAVARFWGYPRAVYLSGELVSSSPELAGAVTAPVDGARKYRVELPDRLAAGRTAAQPTCLVFLARGEDGPERPAIRRLSPAEAVDRSREDFSTAKGDPSVLAAVSADLLSSLAGLTILELTLSSDLDASYDLLLSALRDV
jgi:hypothetical protein